MPSRDDPDFIDALARGLDVIRAFGTVARPATLSELAQASDLARPTVRRVLITLAALGYARLEDGAWSLTPRVLELGLAQIGAAGLWDVARPHLARLSQATGESCSLAQLDGGDIVYAGRVAVPKLVALSVGIGTRFPAAVTSLGKAILAFLPAPERDAALAAPSRSGVRPAAPPARAALLAELAVVRERGWAITDQALAPAIRSIAAPLRRADGAVLASINVNAHAMETPLTTLTEQHLPHLLEAAAAIEADLGLIARLPLASPLG